MKPEMNSTEQEIVPPAGDVIGDTAYSERFVLRILLKFANLDSLKEEIIEKSFEEHLCTLWDMAAERDVVLFLQKHDALKLFNFALPIIDSPRIIEIVVGIIGNMCCQKEATTALLNMESFPRLLLNYMKTDDSLILIQLLRLINSALFLAGENDLSNWMDYFEALDYSESLYFILNNSTNKDLLITALENFNTVCSYLNTEKTRINFFTHFVITEALEALTTGCTEVIVNHKILCERDELERVSIISLQIALNLLGFDKSLELYCDSKDIVVVMIHNILLYYEDKIINQKEMDSGSVDVVDCVNTLVSILQLSVTSDPQAYFMPSYCIWQAFKEKDHQNGKEDFEDNDEKDTFLNEIKTPLCTLLCEYMLKCSEDNLGNILDATRFDCKDIVNGVGDKELQTSVLKRTAGFRTRLKDNVDE